MPLESTSTKRSCDVTRGQDHWQQLARCSAHLQACCEQIVNATVVDRESLERMLRKLDEFCSLAERMFKTEHINH